MNRQQVLNALYRMRKDEFTTIGGHLVYCTGNNIALNIDGMEIEYVAEPTKEDWSGSMRKQNKSRRSGCQKGNTARLPRLRDKW